MDKKKNRKIFAIIFLSFCILPMFTLVSKAYVLLGYGYISHVVPVNLSLITNTTYKENFVKSMVSWNNTGQAYIYQNSDSKNYVGVNSYSDSWLGFYDTVAQEHGLWGRATTFNVFINTRTIAASNPTNLTNYIQSVSTHELGHVLNLGHTTGYYSIMSYDRDRNSMVAPQYDDIQGVDASY